MAVTEGKVIGHYRAAVKDDWQKMGEVILPPSNYRHPRMKVSIAFSFELFRSIASKSQFPTEAHRHQKTCSLIVNLQSALRHRRG